MDPWLRRNKAIAIAGVLLLVLLIGIALHRRAENRERAAVRADLETVVVAYEKIVNGWKYGINYLEFRDWLRAARIARDDLKRKRDLTPVHLMLADQAFGAAESAWSMKVSGVTSIVYEKPYPRAPEEIWWPRGGEFATEDAMQIAQVAAFIEGDDELKKTRQKRHKEVDPMAVVRRAMDVASEAVAEERKWLDKW